MKARFWGTCVFGVLALVALVALSPVEAGEKDSYGSCHAGDRICPAGEGLWLCWSGSDSCPEVRKSSSRADIPKCGPMERLCQIGENRYVCRHVDEKCPEPGLLLAAWGKNCPRD